MCRACQHFTFLVVADSVRIWNVLLHSLLLRQTRGFGFGFGARVDVAAFSLPDLVNFTASRVYCTSCCLYIYICLCDGLADFLLG
jgi:hypothetical protein